MIHETPKYEYFYVSPETLREACDDDPRYRELCDMLDTAVVRIRKVERQRILAEMYEIERRIEGQLAAGMALQSPSRSLEVSTILGKIFSGESVDLPGTPQESDFDAGESASLSTLANLQAHDVGQGVSDVVTPYSYAAQQILGREVENAKVKQIVRRNKRKAADEAAANAKSADASAND